MKNKYSQGHMFKGCVWYRCRYKAANTTIRVFNELVLIMSEEPHVSAHNILPDM